MLEGISKIDSLLMGIALNLAYKNSGLTANNPSVGVVIACVCGESFTILACGVTDIFGRPHAEDIAISALLQNKNWQEFSSTGKIVLYSTLEPCSHYGQTPPCAKKIIECGFINRVVLGFKDPDNRVNGSGAKMLRDGGISVVYYECNDALRLGLDRLYRSYNYSRINKMPYITAKIACSLDGKIATAKGNSKWITSVAVRDFTNFLRSRFNAIAVGRSTFEIDKPQLTCRVSGLEKFSPKKFVISSKNLELPEGWSCVDMSMGVRESLQDLCGRYDVSTLLIEGGAYTISSLLSAKVVSELIVVRSGMIIGGDGKDCINGINVGDLHGALKLTRLWERKVDDCIVECYSV